MSGKRIHGNPPSLDARSISRLRAASPTPEQILENMDKFNEEIEEQAEAEGIELVPSRTEEVQEEDPLDKMNRELEEKLRQQKLLAAQRAAEEAEASGAEAQGQAMTVEDQIRGLLAQQKNAPTEAQIQQWKRQYGEDGVQVIALGEGDVYVFTYLRRGSFQKIQAAMAKQAQIEGMNKDPEEFMMESVLGQCVIWPRLQLEFFYESRSGVVPTLYSSVMLHSYHLTPQQAMVMTAQL